MMSVIDKVLRRVRLAIRRIANKRTAYIYPSENNGWEKYNIPIIGNDDEGTYFDPCVHIVDGRYIMFVSYRNENSIIRFESDDGIRWNNPITVLEGEKDSSWDCIVNRATFIIRENRWMLWYTGMNSESAAIGLAISDDGIHFTRVNKNPLIIPSFSYEKKSVMNPSVLWDEREQLYKMWYAAGEKFEPDVICYATSIDGEKWLKFDRNPVLGPGSEIYDCCKVGGCEVHKTKDIYTLYYIGYENIDNARICTANSVDGITWIRNQENPILSASKGGWDADAVYKPTVCRSVDNEKLYLWYNGRKGHQESIGIAIKN